MSTPAIEVSDITPVLREGALDGALRSPGTTIGRYIVIEEIGRGGMGVVVRAYDPKLQREVALKLLRASAMSEEAQARLVREARAMARLNHPNVVAVYDVDAPTGDAVGLVMEYVPGTTLRDWLRSTRREWNVIVQQFVSAGRGLAAAHAVGLLHRDFKPANVLVGSDDRVRVTDFGLARGGISQDSEVVSERDLPELMSRDDGVSIELTHAGVVLGTPPYMAPEQHTAVELTPAADQYAFCVSLWEGLVGRRPFHGQLARMFAVKQRGAPPWPKEIAVPRPVVSAIERGLSRDPGARWPTMNELLAELEAAIQPRPRRWRLTTAAVVAAGGLSFAAWFVSREPPVRPCSGAERQLGEAWDSARSDAVRDAILGTNVAYAPRAWERLGPALDAYAARWVHVHTEACEATTVRGEQSSTVMDAKMACLHRARMDLDATTRLFAGADVAMVSKAHEVVASLPPLARCEDAVALAGDAPPPPEPARAAAENVLARLADERAAVYAVQYSRADGKIQGLLDDATAAQYEPVLTEVLIESARWHLQAAHYDEAAAAAKHALRSGLRWGQWRSARRACEVLIDVVTQGRTEFATGFAYAETAWGLSLRDDATEFERADLRQSLAALYESQGRPAEAELEARAALEMLERVLAPGDLGVAQSRNTLSMVLMSAGKLEEAEQQQRQSLAVYEAALGARHPTVIVAHNNLAGALAMQGKFAEAEVEMRGVLESWTAALGAEHPRVAGVHHNLSIALYNLGRLEEAAKESRLAIAVASKVMGEEHATIADMRFGLADILHLQGRHAEAEAEARATLELRQKVLGEEHPDVAYSRDQVGMMLTAMGRYADAEAMHAAALVSQEKSLGPAHPDLILLRLHLSEAQMRGGAPERAVQTLQRAREVRPADTEASSADARVDFALARALVASGGDRSQALELARAAEAAHAAMGPEGAAMRQEIAAWVATQG